MKKWMKLLKLLLTVSFVIFTYLQSEQYLSEAPRRVLAIFVAAAMFWSLEIVPLYTTSILVVLSLIFSLCFSKDLNVNVSYNEFFATFANPIIVLFLGGFVIARIMSKYGLDIFIAHSLVNFFGNSPYRILLGFMFTTAFLSMWVSNTATTAMMLAMVGPIVSQFDENDKFRKGFILSIPFGANIGGMGTPVGTPPNAIALGVLAQKGIYISFTSWLMVIFPLVLIFLIFISGILYFLFPSSKKKLEISLNKDEKLSTRGKYSAVIVLIIIFLWLTAGIHHINESIIALLGIGLFSALGFMDRDDFKKLDWDVLFLMWGGMALSKGVKVSNMTEWIINLPIFSHTGNLLIIIFAGLTLFLSSFMSHTAAASLLFPLLSSIADIDIALLLVTSALASSFAMAFPISTPPNAMAFSSGLIKSKDMIKAGAPITIIGFVFLALTFKYFVPIMINL